MAVHATHRHVAGSFPRLMGWHGVRMLFGAVPRGTTGAVVHFEDGSERLLTPRARLVALTIPIANEASGRRPISVRLRSGGHAGVAVKLSWPLSFGWG